MADIGRLQVQVYRVNTAIPISNANITVSRTDGETREQVTTLTTNPEGQTETIELETPEIERSLNPDNTLIPYALYDIDVTAEGFDEINIRGCQVLPRQTALQICNLIPTSLNREITEDEDGQVVRGIEIP
ncbi:MAG TPA: hypothetical protein DCW51_09620, partial [Clostridium sp.]|nr:hypothetical protein [Clostridium sp.]